MPAVLADAELVVGAFFRVAPEVVALVGTRAYTEIPAKPIYPFLRFTRIGGRVRVPRYLDAARMEIEAFGATKASAQNTIAAARAALWEASGTYGPGVITGVEEHLGPQWRPDTVATPARPRYLLDMTITIRPA